MGCGISFVKYVLFVFNLIFALCGLAVLAVGVVFKLKFSEIQQMLQDLNVQAAPILFITVGSIVFIIAFFGCCGAIRESHCMTVTYAVFLIVLLIVQVVIAVCVFVYVDDINKILQKTLQTTFDHRDQPANMEIIDGLQRQFECCGVNGKTDYQLNVIANLPQSCCPAGDAACTFANSYNHGCKTILSDTVKGGSQTIGIVALIIAGVELLGAIFALCLANSIRNEDRRYA
ncbi:23 kDa integral membrane protein-like isoform X2 [Ctenocephalides felis]|uniref:23 kDa integral membrane protein-like isoform X2 n=1 Tax=Ctenocephalides felis TaxID=7515 RepID=UPI000E6E33EF|nr:23 kDa integral membrane protein-like isoform X2 [Ctenocephalides felis]